ncbi:MAG: hypothetical protein FWF96_05975 [Kiritimatiellaeota bacterium]|nr:hypothetical protein [Kiritimatiellota bacterium]
MKNKETIPVWIVTGLLGSGKTTLLERWAAEVVGRRFIFIVNEFSAVDHDTSALAKHGAEIMAMPGGDIFGGWPVEVGDILRQIVAWEELPEHADEPAIEGVVIESGGMANPRGFSKLLGATHLAAWFSVAGVVTLVNAKPLVRGQHNIPNAFQIMSLFPSVRAQVEAATTVLLNKADLCTEFELCKVEARVRKINPSVELLRCQYADAPVAFLR